MRQEGVRAVWNRLVLFPFHSLVEIWTDGLVQLLGRQQKIMKSRQKTGKVQFCDTIYTRICKQHWNKLYKRGLPKTYTSSRNSLNVNCLVLTQTCQNLHSLNWFTKGQRYSLTCKRYTTRGNFSTNLIEMSKFQWNQYISCSIHAASLTTRVSQDEFNW